MGPLGERVSGLKGGRNADGGRGREPFFSSNRCLRSAPSQFSNVEGVARRRVGRDLGLEPVDVAAVTEKVTFQGITAVAFFIV